jgi:hypothetical protein
MAECVPFFDAYPELRTGRAKNDPERGRPAKPAKPAKVLHPFPQTFATFAAFAGGDSQGRKNDYPPEWADGVAQIALMESPLDWPAPRWAGLIEDAQSFVMRWAAQAHRLGWQAWELFGCHRLKPWGATHGMGLVPLLGGHELVVMTSGEAVTRTRAGAHQTYRRRPRDPLHPSERALIWNLTTTGGQK